MYSGAQHSQRVSLGLDYGLSFYRLSSIDIILGKRTAMHFPL